jgi:hypothetical protein
VNEIRVTRVQDPPPAPEKYKRGRWLFLELMAVGDCFDVEGASTTQIRSACSARSNTGKKFVVRGNRVWRVA